MNIKPNSHTYTSLFSVCSSYMSEDKEYALQQATNLLGIMRRSGVTIEPITYKVNHAVTEQVFSLAFLFLVYILRLGQTVSLTPMLVLLEYGLSITEVAFPLAMSRQLRLKLNTCIFSVTYLSVIEIMSVHKDWHEKRLSLRFHRLQIPSILLSYTSMSFG